MEYKVPTYLIALIKNFMRAYSLFGTKNTNPFELKFQHVSAYHALHFGCKMRKEKRAKGNETKGCLYTNTSLGDISTV